MSTQAPDSLVKYDNPTLVSTSITNKRGKAKAKGKNTAALTKQEQVRHEKEKRDQDFLNAILPPREYTEDGSLWVRYVSP